MEELALEGAVQLFSTHRPIALIEWIKSDKQAIVDYFAVRNYSVHELGMNLLCIPKDKEPIISMLNTQVLVA